MTNNGGTQSRQVTYSPFANGTVVCNIFYPTTDCQTVNNGVAVYLLNGESKIYVPKDQLASGLGEDELTDIFEGIADLVHEVREAGKEKVEDLWDDVEGLLDSLIQ